MAISTQIDQQPKSHHFVPAFYLGAWAGGDGRVTRYYRPHDEVVASPIAPKNTGYEDHLYTVKGVPPEQQQYLETQFFAPIDSRAAIAHRLLLEGKLNQLSNDQRVDWARFMMSMQLRSPFSLGEVSALALHNIRAVTDKSDPEYDAIREDGDPKTLFKWTVQHQPLVIEEAYKRMLPGLIDHKDLGQYLINMCWATLDLTNSNRSLLTGDRPFISTRGWKAPDAILLFPLSPTRILVITNNPDLTRKVAKTSQNHVARYTNTQIIQCAVDFVYGRDGFQLGYVSNLLRRKEQEPIPGPVGKGRPGVFT
jgi:hypothetical protein